MHRRTFITTTATLAAACRSGVGAYSGPHRGLTLDPWRARPTIDDFKEIRTVNDVISAIEGLLRE